MTEQIKHCDRKELKGKCSMYKTANLQDCINCNRALQKPITEQIKSAIETFEDYKENGYDLRTSNAELFELAIRSLQAWDEVLNQLQEWKNSAENEHEQKISYAYFSAIKIINQHLSEIEEGEEI